MPTMPTQSAAAAPSSAPAAAPDYGAEVATLRTQLSEARSQLTALDSANQETAREAALSAALADAASSGEFHQAAVGQLAALLRDEVVVTRDQGRYVATGPGLRPLNEHVRTRLAQPEFSHFRKGGGPSSPAAASSAPIMPTGEPKTLTDALLIDHAAQRAMRAGGSDARLDPRQSFGLGRIR